MPRINAKETFLGGFWQWVEILAARDYQQAVEALYWPREVWMTPAGLEETINKFLGNTGDPFIAVIPNQRLIDVVNDGVEIEWRGEGGWAMAQIPITPKPEKAKDEDVPLPAQRSRSLSIRTKAHT